MKQTYFLIVLLTGVLGSVSWTAQDIKEQIADGYNYDTYQIVSQRNIFSRNRQPAERINKSPVIIRREPVTLSLYVLKGVAANSDQKIAFIEEEVSGESIKGRIGTEVLDGKIKDIQHSYVVFEENGQSRQIKIGEVFGKTESLAENVSEPEKSPPSKEETERNDITPSNENDILKKMLERRKNELGT